MFHIVKNESGDWELWRDGRVVGVFRTHEEARESAR